MEGAKRLWQRAYLRYEPPGSRRAEWRKFIRERELEMVLRVLAEKRELQGYSSVLEVGSGSGYQAAMLAKTFSNVIATDVEAVKLHVRSDARFVVTSAESLCFGDATFDLIFSSCVLEHIVDKDRALREMKRVLKLGGVMVHTVPTAFCPLLTLFPGKYLFLVIMLLNVLRELVGGKPSSGQEASPSVTSVSSAPRSAAAKWPALRRDVVKALRLLLPVGVHGTAKSTIAELVEFRHRSWMTLFLRAGLRVRHSVNLFTYSMYLLNPFRFISFRTWLSRLGITSCRAYFLEVCPAVTAPHTVRKVGGVPKSGAPIRPRGVKAHGETGIPR